jgi:hypothetical protein
VRLSLFVYEDDLWNAQDEWKDLHGDVSAVSRLNERNSGVASLLEAPNKAQSPLGSPGHVDHSAAGHVAGGSDSLVAAYHIE